MKTVFRNSMTAHVWAQMNQPRGRNAASSMSFDGTTAYSYREPVAHIVRVAILASTAHPSMAPCDPESSRPLIALFTSHHWSPTTAGHVGEYRSAVRGRKSFTVPDLLLGRFDTRPDDIGHAVNVAYLNEQYDKLKAELLRSPCDSYRVANEIAQDIVDGVYATRAHRLLCDAANLLVDYVTTFNIAVAKDYGRDWKGDANQVISRRDRLLADPERAAKREAGRVQREKALAKAIEAARLERLERERTALERWNSGGNIYAYERLSDAQGGALLRISPGGLDVQTSWGAAVPLRDAKRVLALYDTVMSGFAAHPDRGQWEPQDSNERANVGHFRITRIHQDGRIVIGCHTIFPAEIESLRTKLV